MPYREGRRWQEIPGNLPKPGHSPDLPASRCQLTFFSFRLGAVRVNAPTIWLLCPATIASPMQSCLGWSRAVPAYDQPAGCWGGAGVGTSSSSVTAFLVPQPRPLAST